MMDKVSIVGCGWLGLPLGKLLVEKGFVVKGSTTTANKIDQLRSLGIKAFLVNFLEDLKVDQDIFDTDVLVVTLPPSQKKQSEQKYLESLEFLVSKTSPGTKLIFTSSTSIYKSLSSELREEDVMDIKDSGYALLFNAENIFVQSGRPYTVVRFGGLTGYDRILIKYFAGKKELTFGHEPVNLIHRDDAVQILFEVIRQQKWNNIFNACAPRHPLKKDFYTFLAETYNFEKPHFADSLTHNNYKVINPDKLIRELSYQFKFEDPYSFTY
ncbi:NAD-dependent epimerase/dehydratase [Sporocytophaga myxococcoides]|uniref:NAD-dependent epimerase/dehydratase n=1 Tax=Sporocytophaga myxococcoides TaxID=153721 RepID=A0A098LD36_9BACT|nr:NAD(P)H-binding protein [Sporocytophaga myxococcoides]GAL84826.1 NAD-dependent epimerase/dehydratase [Sporocytophaga myxococcoides]